MRRGSAAGLPTLLIAALILGAPAHLLAQQIPDTVLVLLRPGQVLRLRLDDGRRVVARLLALDSGRAILRVASLEEPVPRATIDSLWVRGQATAAGAIVGGIVLAVPSFLFWGALCEGLSEGGGCQEWGTVTALSLGAGGVGALIGAVFGSAIPKWRLRYGRPRIEFGPGSSALRAAVRIPF